MNVMTLEMILVQIKIRIWYDTLIPTDFFPLNGMCLTQRKLSVECKQKDIPYSMEEG